MYEPWNFPHTHELTKPESELKSDEKQSIENVHKQADWRLIFFIDKG